MGNVVASGCVSNREPRHNQLLSAVDQFTNIRKRLEDLKLSLGVVLPELKDNAKQPEEPPPCNLVDAMDRLPSMVSTEVDQIHRSIDELSESLL